MTNCRAVNITLGEDGTSYRKKCGLRRQLDELLRKARILEEAARQNEQRSRLILESSLDAVVITDDQGFITYWNGQADKTFGWSRDEALDLQLTDVILPTRYLRAPPESGLNNILPTGKEAGLSRRIQITALHRNGHEFPVELAISSAVVDAEWMFIIFARDLSEPRRVEEMLRRCEEQVRLLLSSTALAILDANLEGKRTLCNASSLGILGDQSPKDLERQNMYALAHHSNRFGLQAEDRLAAEERSLVDVMIVDDSPAVRKILLRVLKQAEIRLGEVREAGDGLEALEVLRQFPVQLILCDIKMPKMDGIELLKCIRAMEHLQSVPVIMVTTEASQAQVMRAL